MGYIFLGNPPQRIWNTLALNYVPCYWDTILNTHNFKEERFVLARVSILGRLAAWQKGLDGGKLPRGIREAEHQGRTWEGKRKLLQWPTSSRPPPPNTQLDRMPHNPTAFQRPCLWLCDILGWHLNTNHNTLEIPPTVQTKLMCVNT